MNVIAGPSYPPGHAKHETTAGSSLSTIDTGSGQKIPAICHGTGVCHGVFTPESKYEYWEWADSRL